MNINQYLIHPGESLKEFIEEYNVDLTDLSNKLEICGEELNNILNGKSDITPIIAHKLSKVYDPPEYFWNNLQINYNKTLFDDRCNLIVKELNLLKNKVNILNNISLENKESLNKSLDKINDILAGEYDDIYKL